MKKKQVPSAGSELSLALRRFLYLSAALTGAAIMVIEILGAKMLAPYFGTSHFVWTAQIAVTLVALAAGYYVGGRLADQSPDLARLYGFLLVAAIYLCVSVLLIRTVAAWCLHYQLAVGSLLASCFLFFVPLALLAMVGPFFVRVLTSSVESVGVNIGRLTAVSTLGSFLGTVLIGYVLIPYLPNSITMYLTAAVLFALVAAYFTRWGFDRVTTTAMSIGILLGLVLCYGGYVQESKPDFAKIEELYRANSNFGLLQVVQFRRIGAGETPGPLNRYYLNDYLVQNTFDPDAGKSVSTFTYMLHLLAQTYTPAIHDVLCIGLGVGIAPMQFANDGNEVDVVEINRAVVKVASNYFNCDPSKLHITIGDGRQYLNACRKDYDTIVLDAFLGDSSPIHLMSREAFTEMKRVLKPNGTLVINSFGDFSPGKDFYTASLDKTLRSVFRSVVIHTSGNGNVFFVASDQAELKMLRSPDVGGVHPSSLGSVREAFAGMPKTDPNHGIVLTDDYNPVEFRDAANREATRKNLVAFLQSLQ